MIEYQLTDNESHSILRATRNEWEVAPEAYKNAGSYEFYVPLSNDQEIMIRMDQREWDKLMDCKKKEIVVLHLMKGISGPWQVFGTDIEE